MSLPSSYHEVKLVRGHLVNQIKNLDQKGWMKACQKLGLYVAPDSGRGSHCAIYESNVCPPENSDCCVVTLPRNIYPNFQRDLLKKVVYFGIKTSRYDEDAVWKALGII